MVSRLDPDSLAHATSADNCTKCDGEGLIPQWPHDLLTPSGIVAGYGKWTDPCPECDGPGLQTEDDGD